MLCYNRCSKAGREIMGSQGDPKILVSETQNVDSYAYKTGRCEGFGRLQFGMLFVETSGCLCV